jgi:hypothetical protein
MNEKSVCSKPATPENEDHGQTSTTSDKKIPFA